jgi:hypothetical protein
MLGKTRNIRKYKDNALMENWQDFTERRFIFHLTTLLNTDCILSVKRHVAFQNVFGTPVAVVEVARAELGSQEAEQRLLQLFAKEPQLLGNIVLLGAPHDGPLVAAFSGPQDLCMALSKIGWIRLPWQEIELSC